MRGVVRYRRDFALAETALSKSLAPRRRIFTSTYLEVEPDASLDLGAVGLEDSDGLDAVVLVGRVDGDPVRSRLFSSHDFKKGGDGGKV